MPIGISDLCKNMHESPTLAVTAKAQALTKQGYKVINFGVGEPDFQTPAFIREATKFAVDNGYTKYTLVSGIPELKEAIIKKVAKDHNIQYQSNQVIVSSGAKHSIYNCLKAILNPGDEVILPVPCWASYPDMIELCGGVPVIVHGNANNDFLPTFEDIKSRVTNRTKAILINTPSNPTGNVWPKELLEKVANLALESSFYIISDEIYEKLLYDNKKHISIASLSKEIQNICILINGVSKAYSMTGFRIGYALGPVDVISAMVKYQSQTTTSATTMSQYAAKVAVESDDSCCEYMRSNFEKRRDILVQKINAIEGISCPTPSGAFYIMIDVRKIVGKIHQGKPIFSSTDFALAVLESKKVALVPGDPFYAHGFCRISYALDIQDAMLGIERIKEFVEELQ